MEQISVLLLSNDAAVLGMTNKIFDDYGFSVNVVRSVPEANALIKRNTFDLAVYDNDVPGALNLAPQRATGSTPHVVFGMVNRTQSTALQGKRVNHGVLRERQSRCPFYARSSRRPEAAQPGDRFQAAWRQRLCAASRYTAAVFRNDYRRLQESGTARLAAATAAKSMYPR